MNGLRILLKPLGSLLITAGIAQLIYLLVRVAKDKKAAKKEQ